MQYKSFSQLSKNITQNLSELYDGDFDLVVGIPRSGMIPAYMIGLYLNVNVTTLDAFLDNRKLVTGSTRKTKNKLECAWDAQRVLLVDDSIASGKSMQNALEQIPAELRKKVTSLAVYSSKKSRKDIDIYLEYVPMPRVFEWNVFHRNLMENACLDIDGVLCVDPTEEQNDDGEKYIDFILNAKPLFIPSSRVKALVTSRLEKYRSQTEQWLTKHGVEYEHLIMLDLPTKEERQRLGAHGAHKAKCYIKSDSDFFVESEQAQAIYIMQQSGKPVFCTGDNRMYTPGMGVSLLKSPSNFAKRMKSFMVSKMSDGLIRFIKPIYKSIFR